MIWTLQDMNIVVLKPFMRSFDFILRVMSCWKTNLPRSCSFLADCIRFLSRISLYFAALIYPHKPSRTFLRLMLISVDQKHTESPLIQCYKTIKHEIYFLLALHSECCLPLLATIKVTWIAAARAAHTCTRLRTQHTAHRIEPHLFHSAAFALCLLIQIDLSCH